MQTLAAGTTANTWVGGIAAGLAVLAAYWAPTIIALIRRVPGAGQVVAVNGLLGWTVIGWIAALVMAFRARPAGQVFRPPNGV